MQDEVIKGSGDSRFLRSIPNFMTQYPTYEAFAQALKSGALPIDFAGKNITGIAQDGTPLNKRNLLQDATAARLMLSDAAVPDDAFNALVPLNAYLWRKRYYGSGWSIKVSGSTTRGQIVVDWGPTETWDFKYSDSVTVNQSDGTLSLDNPQTLSVSYNTYTNADTLKGKYWVPASSSTTALSSARYTPVDAESVSRTTARDSDQRTIYYVYASYATAYGQYSSGYGEPEFEFGVEDAHTEGITGNYEYHLLGKYVDIAGNAPKIETGTYVGTGTYGLGNENTLNFFMAPFILFISPNQTYMTPWDAVSRQTWADRSVTWYSTSSAADQRNTLNQVYHWIAIGE